MPILVFLVSVLDLGPMYATDRQASDVVRQKYRLMPPPRRQGIIILHNPTLFNALSGSKSGQVVYTHIVRLSLRCISLYVYGQRAVMLCVWKCNRCLWHRTDPSQIITASRLGKERPAFRQIYLHLIMVDFYHFYLFVL